MFYIDLCFLVTLGSLPFFCGVTGLTIFRTGSFLSVGCLFFLFVPALLVLTLADFVSFYKDTRP